MDRNEETKALKGLAEMFSAITYEEMMQYITDNLFKALENRKLDYVALGIWLATGVDPLTSVQVSEDAQ